MDDLIICGSFSSLIKENFSDKVKIINTKQELLSLEEGDQVVLCKHRAGNICNIPRLHLKNNVDKQEKIFFNLPKSVKRIYSTSCNVINNKIFCEIPYGIFQGQHSLSCFKDVLQQKYDKNNLVYANFRYTTSNFRKFLINEFFVDKDFINYDKISIHLRKIKTKFSNKKMPWPNSIMTRFYNNVAQSKFCFCPEGHSPGSYRFWESVMLGTIPIVSNFPAFNNLKIHFPILIVDDYNLITKEYLEEQYEKLTNQEYTKNYFTCNYWINKIQKDLDNL